jgi:hypothetical protein
MPRGTLSRKRLAVEPVLVVQVDPSRPQTWYKLRRLDRECWSIKRLMVYAQLCKEWNGKTLRQWQLEYAKLDEQRMVARIEHKRWPKEQT